jgi:fatty-acyl-CoA synthase
MEQVVEFERLRRCSIPGILAQVAAAGEDAIAVVDAEHRITYAELLAQSRSLAVGLRATGVEFGDRVGVCVPNWHEFVVAYFALGTLGAILVPVNTRYTAREAEYILHDSGARALITADRFADVDLLEMFRGLRSGLPELRTPVVVRPSRDLGPDERGFADLIAEGAAGPFGFPELVPEDDLFAILYTSGTTGEPKGAMLTHRNVAATTVATVELMRCTADDVFLVPVPLSHIFGMGPSILAAVCCGGRMVLQEMYKASAALELIERERVTVHHGVPTMFILELNSPDFDDWDLSSLRTGIIAAAPCPIEVVKAIRERMGCDITVSFGMTEASPSLTSTRFEDSDEDRAETVGQALPGVELRIVDENGHDVVAGDVGEIVGRSPGVMKGYFRRPDETRHVLSADGWYSTGDLGTLDERGFLRIVGRKKEMIIRGGYNIYPREVEEVIYQHPGVLEVAIVGLDDVVMGERTCACVKLKADAGVSEQQIREFCGDSLAKYKIPDSVRFLEEFPTTTSGKILKRELRRLVNSPSDG